MSKTIKALLTLVLAIFACAASYGQADQPVAEDKTVTFKFLPGNDLFLLKGNETELERLYALIEEYHTEITAGGMPVYVDGYCASMPTPKENLTTAFVRANRVKSELIIRKGLKEKNFVTANYPHAYLNNKDVVVVTLRIPATKQPQPEAIKEQPKRKEPKTEVKPQPKPAVEKQRQSEPEPQPVVETVSEGRTPYTFAVRTNLLYDALLLPTLGVEWRISPSVGVKLDGSLSWWGWRARQSAEDVAAQPRSAVVSAPRKMFLYRCFRQLRQIQYI